ncbi:adenylyltransferase/cytidyltransferase family protein [Candidatus Gottesmanbacteria bacterium]|nr:adenylyltransferase/cytidyltransferase family protein [Candidatus Gottesmanbacteria bacterium]
MMHIPSVNIYTSGNIISLAAAAPVIRRLRKEGKTVGLCHGGFDLLHPGHVKHFESAKKLCDVLVVSVTSDRFVVARKGQGRPIFPDRLRAYMIASLRMVDWAVVTDVKLGVDVISTLKPSLYIKGPDFIGKQTPGITAEREAIKAVGGTMAYTEDPKLSTTSIIDYIRKL